MMYSIVTTDITLIQLDVLLLEVVDNEEKTELDPPQRSQVEFLSAIMSLARKWPSDIALAAATSGRNRKMCSGGHP